MMFSLVDGSPKLLHGKYDHDDFVKVMEKTDLIPFPEEKASQIILAYNYFIQYNKLVQLIADKQIDEKYCCFF